MPDFATPLGASSLAHAQLAAVVREPAEDPPGLVAAVASFASRAMARFITINTTVDPFRVHPDLWWGHLG